MARAAGNGCSSHAVVREVRRPRVPRDEACAATEAAQAGNTTGRRRESVLWPGLPQARSCNEQTVSQMSGRIGGRSVWGRSRNRNCRDVTSGNARIKWEPLRE